jgi:hypothetical protein
MLVKRSTDESNKIHPDQRRKTTGHPKMQTNSFKIKSAMQVSQKTECKQSSLRLSNGSNKCHPKQMRKTAMQPKMQTNPFKINTAAVQVRQKKRMLF